MPTKYQKIISAYTAFDQFQYVRIESENEDEKNMEIIRVECGFVSCFISSSIFLNRLVKCVVGCVSRRTCYLMIYFDFSSFFYLALGIIATWINMWRPNQDKQTRARLRTHDGISVEMLNKYSDSVDLLTPSRASWNHSIPFYLVNLSICHNKERRHAIVMAIQNGMRCKWHWVGVM